MFLLVCVLAFAVHIICAACEVWSVQWGYSSVVEHLTADQEVPGSNPGAPFLLFFTLVSERYTYSVVHLTDVYVLNATMYNHQSYKTHLHTYMHMQFREHSILLSIQF